MSFIEILILSVALATDAMLVSFSYGLVINKQKILNSLILSLTFGFFQFLMPIIGWHVSNLFYERLELYSNWIVFLIFMILGIKFIKNAFEKKKEQEVNCISFLCVIGLGMATSIDALGAGISIKFTDIYFLYPSVIIGIITGINSFIGFWIANILKKLPSKNIEIIGGILLIFLSVKTLLQ